MAVEDNGAVEEGVSIGAPTANWIRADGEILAHVIFPSSGSLAAGRQIGETIKAVLRYQTINLGVDGSVRTVATIGPDSGDIHSGLWHSVLITILFECNYTAATV